MQTIPVNNERMSFQTNKCLLLNLRQTLLCPKERQENLLDGIESVVVDS